MTEIQRYVDAAIAAGKDVWVAGPTTESEIAKLEATLGVKLPTDYRSFLQRFGALSIGDNLVSGIIEGSPLSPDGGSIYGDTKRGRVEQSLPPELLVLQPDGDAPYCLDPALEGVVCYQVSTKTSKKIASSFHDWLRLFVFA